ARLTAEIDLLVLKDAYQPGDVEGSDIGYVFCPEHRTGAVEPIYAERSGAARLWLFGPALLPDEDCLAEPRAAAHSEPIASDEEASRPTTV
ncbi:hypothetical protein, partial [Klebsiella aerogenes]|uniref:hypothetical protein n=1 Tax=Klebsiella aerogenes TaxID=548 RepID=UPI0013D59D1E